ncbi:recombinase family protein [Phenylobacterium sp.]|jgi:DNA invertase Pin-like site-specific DNA recombinase|uniref:recombinase family protein n=1 Tax=Phenylobacterium sp. TaxID=1871053 RepID=UPI002F9307BA
MLRIGYAQSSDGDDAETLRRLGCHVVRAEEPDAPPGYDSAALYSVLDFIGQGDQLVVTRLEHLGHGSRLVLDVLDKLEQRGASLYVAEPPISTEGEGGRALRAALEAVAAVDPQPLLRRRRGAPAREIIELQRAGVGPVEIARRLGVSRMTVWRKLKSAHVA